MPTTATASNAASISPRMLPSRCPRSICPRSTASRRSSKARIGSDHSRPAPPQLRHEDAPESGVAENSRGERIHHGRKGFHGRRSLTGDSHKVVDDLANALHEDAGGDIGLAGEVVVGHALRNARHLHDALHRRVGVAAFGNDLDRRIQQLAPGGVRLARSPLLLGHAPPSRPRNRQCRVQNASTGSAPSGNHSFWSSQRSCGH